MSQLDPKRRVVVTGLGVVSSIGIGWQEFWKNLLAGKSGIDTVRSIDTTSYEHHRAGEVRCFPAHDFVNRHKVAKLGRASLFAIAASKMAVKDAGFTGDNSKVLINGICVGTTMGESQLIEFMEKTMVDSDESQIGNLEALSYPANSIATNVADELNIEGQNILFANACAAGNYALGYAFDLIQNGKADVMLAGGSDSLSRIAFTGFGRLYAMSTDICQPFDINRNGMMLGEGAGMLFLEEYNSAINRGATIYAEIGGYGMSCDAHHMTNPDPAGVVKAIQKSLKSAEIKVEDVNYISAHGTGTPENDKAECEAINRVFGERTPKIPVSSIKSMLGHTMGAASALESITCCLAVKYGQVPPTINLLNRDPFCDIDCVPNKGREHRVNVALNNSQAFGGNNAVTILLEL
jgi:3-oxoacyl-[acyl-carrier-protein] synthase II